MTKVFEDYISGKLSHGCEQDQVQLKAVAEAPGREVKQQGQKKTNVKKLISVGKTYTDMTRCAAAPSMRGVFSAPIQKISPYPFTSRKAFAKLYPAY